MVDKVSPSMIASARRNLLINGGFRIWQRGAGPFNSVTIGPDKWGVNSGGDDFSSGSEVERNPDSKFGNYSCRVRDLESDSRVFIEQRLGTGGLEEDARQFSGEEVTASAWVKQGSNENSDSALMRVIASGPGGQNSQEDTVTPDSEWKRLSVTVEVPSDVDNIEVELSASATESPDLSSTGEVYFDGATLVVGDEPVDYPAVMRPVGQEQSLCERYYETYDFDQSDKVSPIRISDTILDMEKFSTTKSSVPTMTGSISTVQTSNIDGNESDDTSNWSINSLVPTRKLHRIFLKRNSGTSLDLGRWKISVEAEVT